MGRFELAALSPHASWSSLSNYQQCSWRYYLEKVVQIPETPALYFAGGSAVHTATEEFDRGSDLPPRSLFLDAFEKEIADRIDETGIPLDQWRVGGRATKANPDKENYEWWRREGPVMVQAWVDWRARCGWELWWPSADVPGIELALHVTMGGVPVKMFIDRVFVTPGGQLKVLDIKSGSSEPDSYNQLGLYACGLELTFGVRPQLGGYWMARKGEVGQVFDLEHLTPELMGGWISDWDRARKAGIFIPHPTRLCRTCGVKDYCAAVGGTKAGTL
jgi:putative RecB family exonuclease